MHHLVHTIVAFIQLHGAWAGPVMFVVSFGESFVGLSLLFPGTTIMIIAGTLVRWPMNPHGVLDVWPLLIGGILGAVSGDAISFRFGRRFGHLLEKHWYFVRHPDFLTRGYAFFDRFGTASVFVGRFFGPVRAAIPLVAGIMNMPWRQFWIANIGSALVWAPALLLVGTSFREVLRALGLKHGEPIALSIAGVVLLMVLVATAYRFGLFDRLLILWRKHTQRDVVR
ncbi:MAG TPA: DedA family protein [Rhizomicrobium sp.]|jgi:membrane protein DedA with SNARE-associated domain|nr:DedA family protein [Rhizomicrobium sp.]